MAVEPVEILLVEDNPGDVRLTREALREGKVRNNLSVAPDGVEALAFLRREGKYADAPRPDLILLDLNLPRKDGREVLAEIKADPALRNIPVVVLTSSRGGAGHRPAPTTLHANCYITKPVDLDQFITRGQVDRGLLVHHREAPAGAAAVTDAPVRILLVEDNPGDARLLRDHAAGGASRCASTWRTRTRLAEALDARGARGRRTWCCWTCRFPTRTGWRR